MICDTCGAILDLRAPLVRVQGTRVASYCSTECMAGLAPAPEPAVEPADEAIGEPLAVAESAESPEAAIEAPPHVAAAPTRRRPLAWRVAINLVSVTVAVALAGLLWHSVPSQPETAVALPVPPPPPEEPAPPLDSRARELLEDYLADQNPDLAFQAAEALARLGDPRGQKVLRETLGQGHNPRRMRAARQLAAQGDPDALELLRSRLKSRHREVRTAAARALAMAGDDSGREELRALLNRRRTRSGAASALATLGDQVAISVLHRQLDSDDDGVRMRAAMVLGRVGDPAAAPELHRLLGDPRFEVGASIALAQLSDPAARPGLEASLPHSALRVEAAEALAKLDGSPTDALVRAIDEEPPAGRISAALAILLLMDDGAEEPR